MKMCPGSGWRTLALSFLFMMAADVVAPMDASPLRVGIHVKVDSIKIGTEGSYQATDRAGKKDSFNHRRVFLVKAHGSQIRLGEAVWNPPVRLRAEEGNLRVNGRRYRGDVEILAEGGKITVVNSVDVESYLQGVLPREVGPAWPQESLKAQAVMSRTYALRNRGRFSSQGFDLRADYQSQVYGGRDSETPSTSQAVQSTRGMILVYQGEPAWVAFHSNCGGRTEESGDVWGGQTEPYVQSVHCRGGKDQKYYRWKKSFSQEKIENALRRKGYDIGRLQSIKIHSRTKSGRIREIRLRGSRAVKTLRGNDFRMLMDPGQFLSTWVKTIVRDGSTWTFHGQGWGHGVGLCQWGAKDLADDGWSMKKILNHYYPGTKVDQFEEIF